MRLYPGTVGFVTQAKVDGEVLSGSPVVLNIPGKNISSMAPLSGGNTLAVRGGQTKVEIGSAIPTGSRGYVGRIRRGECTVENDGSERAAVAGVEVVHAVAPELKAHVEHMAVVSQDHRIRSLNHRVLESLLDSVAADVGKNSGGRATGISTIETQFEQSRSTSVRVCDPELRTQVADRAVELGAVMQFDVVDAEAKIVQQVRTEGVAPVHHVVVDGRVREAGAQQGKRVDRRVVLLGVRKAAEDMVVVVALKSILMSYWLVLISWVCV